jgi:flavorubredoxin
MCTYDSKHEILFTDKLFGCHTCSDQVFDEGWQSLSPKIAAIISTA